MNKSMEQKLKELNVDEKKWPSFSKVAVDEMYDRLKHHNAMEFGDKERFLYFLNEILDKAKLDYVKDILDFSIKREDLIQVDGIKFIEEKRDKLDQYGIHLNKNLYFSKAKKNKNYILNVLKGLSKFYGYKVEKKIKAKYIDKKRCDWLYYYLKKSIKV